MLPLAACIRTAERCLSDSASGEEAVVVGSLQVCTLICEVTCNLDTQLRTYRDPVETGAPPMSKHHDQRNRGVPGVNSLRHGHA
jgi:hypothetical protein